ncbi:LysR family transcriptional regulator [Pseudoduganella sp. FT26W]|uniref:LysR family transcriptional regulator n=1 Tax=Duganella aquatilis TaxID=2666082 RepID=A0A844CZW5_9BURK|nr:LysR family transcriptional regulator [Duganella aquatilis]MRW86357.1 LysR family transcriptional regulator [Duganella aquatilis]
MPTSNDFDWNDIPLILALARSGSMSATGRQLGVDASTISRRIAAAEKALKLRLFIRDNTGYQLTDAGQVFVEHGEAVYDNVQSMLHASSQEADATAGPVNITSIDFLFDYWLLDHVPALHAQHPHLQLTLQAENQNLSFTRREADFALRLGKPGEDAALVMRKLGELGFAVYGHRKFADTPRACWGTQPWIAYDDVLGGTAEMQWLAGMNPQPRKVLKVNSLSTMVRACRAGVGMALLPCIMGEQEGLQRIGAKVEVLRDIWLLSHRDAGTIARFKTVSAWLSGVYAASGHLLCGADSHP